MKKTEANQLMYDILLPDFKSKNFRGKRRKGEFIKKMENGFDGFAFDMIDFNPIQRCRYSVFKRLNNIENIMQKVVNVYSINYTANEESLSLAFSYGTYKNLNTTSYMPEMQNEKDVQESAILIIDFMNTVGFSLLERFNDIREIDKEINGEEFWETDWRMPFNLGGGFNCKRLIIAHLCSNPKFEELYNFHIAVHEQAKIDYPEYPEQLINGENYLQYLKRILLDIKPLY